MVSSQRAAALGSRLERLAKLLLFESFRDLDWRTPAASIAALEEERRTLEAASDRLRALQDALARVLRELHELRESEEALREARGSALARQEACRAALRECDEVLAAASGDAQARLSSALESMRADALEGRALTVESADAREREFREFLQARLDAEGKKVERLEQERIGFGWVTSALARLRA